MIMMKDLQKDKRAGVAQSIQRLGYGPDDWGSIPGRGNDGFLSRHCVQAISGVHPPSYPIGTGGSYPMVKATGM
jgi:hypothetical protein